MAEARGGSEKLQWLVLATVIIGTFLGRLDQTIVSLATPKIIDGFGITVSEAGWISTAYIIANAVFVPVWGKLGDLIGRKKVYLAGFSLFIVGSVLCGISWSLGSLIAFRVIQAIAGSADYPTAMSIIAATFPDRKKRAQALGIWSSSFAAASVFGPLIGGPLIDGFGWRSVFIVNLPVGVIGAIMAMRYVRESRAEAAKREFDWWGAITLGGALSALVLVLEKGIDWGWTSPKSLVAYGVVLAFGYLFVRIEQSVREPMVNLDFFKVPVLVNTMLNNFVVFFGFMGGIFLIPIFVQQYMGYDATETGLLFMPMVAGMMIGAALGGKFLADTEPGVAIAGSTAIAAVGLFMFMGLDAASGPADVIWPLVVMAFGMGLAMSHRTNIVTLAVPVSEVGMASSVLALARNIAGAFGIAIFGTILRDATERNVLDIGAASAVRSADPTVWAQAIALIGLKAQIEAYHAVFVTAGIAVVVGAALALLIRVPKRVPGEEGAEAAEDMPFEAEPAF